MNESQRKEEIKKLNKKIEQTREQVGIFESISKPESNGISTPFFAVLLISILASTFLLNSAFAYDLEPASDRSSPLPPIQCEAHPQPTRCA